jgi:hypothetical protein
MLIDSIIADVDLSVREPPVQGLLGVIEDLGVLLVPVHLLVLSEHVPIPLLVLLGLLLELVIMLVGKLLILTLVRFFFLKGIRLLSFVEFWISNVLAHWRGRLEGGRDRDALL